MLYGIQLGTTNDSDGLVQVVGLEPIAHYSCGGYIWSFLQIRPLAHPVCQSSIIMTLCIGVKSPPMMGLYWFYSPDADAFMSLTIGSLDGRDMIVCIVV